MIRYFQKKKARPKKIGLALGSGSSRGWAHIGVIKALTEAGIRIDYVAGTSIGAVVGAVYASGRITTLEDVALRLDWKKVVNLLDIVFPKSGIIDGNKITEFIREQVKAKIIEELPLPFAAVSTDLATGREVIIREGDIIEAIRASVSVPGVFTPIRRAGMFLLDGALVNPVPVSVVREMGADFVIAVDLNHDIISKKGDDRSLSPEPVPHILKKDDGRFSMKENRIMSAFNAKFKSIDFSFFPNITQRTPRNSMPNIFEVLLASINIMETQITVARLKTDPPDILIQPALGHIKFLEFNRAEEVIAEGYREAKSHINLLTEEGQVHVYP